jgi:aspartate-semialdehyde dehydrogenase
MPEKLHRVAVVGASSLLGKELKQVLEERRFPAGDIILLDASVMAGTLTEAAGEATFIRALDEDSFERARFVFFAGSPADTKQNWLVAQRAGATVIDLTGVLAAKNPGASETAGAVAWIPSLGQTLPPQLAPGADNSPGSRAAYSSPSSPVIAVCTLAAALKSLAPQHISVLLFPPVSERDQAGVEELESQTASLLSFREIGRPVFDAQVAFNLLSAYGPESKLRLEDLRAAIAREAASYLAGRAPVPAIQLVQAPVFYGYAFAAHAQFGSTVPPTSLESAFAGLGVKIAAPDDPAPSNVSAAGDSEILLAAVGPDPNVFGSVWLWGVADNLRLAATNAVRIAEEVLARSPD